MHLPKGLEGHHLVVELVHHFVHSSLPQAVPFARCPRCGWHQSHFQAFRQRMAFCHFESPRGKFVEVIMTRQATGCHPMEGGVQVLIYIAKLENLGQFSFLEQWICR